MVNLTGQVPKSTRSGRLRRRKPGPRSPEEEVGRKRKTSRYKIKSIRRSRHKNLMLAARKVTGPSNRIEDEPVPLSEDSIQRKRDPLVRRTKYYLIHSVLWLQKAERVPPWKRKESGQHAGFPTSKRKEREGNAPQTSTEGNETCPSFARNPHRPITAPR